MKVLKKSIDLAVRFSETDAMGVVWHGNYLKFFEDARECLGKEYNLDNLAIFNQGYFTPIVHSEIDHKAPIYYGENLRVTAILEFRSAAKIVFRYEVLNLSTNKLAAIGQTIQVFLSAKERTLELNKPDFYANWEEQQPWINE